MLVTGPFFQLFLCLLTVAGVSADSNVPVLELDVLDDAFESELRDYNLYRVTPLEGLLIPSIYSLEKPRQSRGESTVTGATATPPHGEYSTNNKRTISRRARQVSGSVDGRIKKSIDQGSEEANLSNQLPNDNVNFDNDGSGDGQPDFAPVPDVPRSQQAEIHLTPESGYSPSSTIPKSRMNSQAIESIRQKAPVISSVIDHIEGDIAETNSAEERESIMEADTPFSDPLSEGEEKSATVEHAPTEVESGFTERGTSAEGRGNVSDDTLEVSDQPDSRFPSARSLDETSGSSTQSGRDLNILQDLTSFSGVNSVRSNASGKSSQDERSKSLISAPRPTTTPTNSGSTYLLLGDGETVRLLKDNIAFLVGVILGVPVFISTCYMLNRRRRRTGSMDITPVTSESSKQKMSSAQDSRRTVTCKTENELSSCPCQT